MNLFLRKYIQKSDNTLDLPLVKLENVVNFNNSKSGVNFNSLTLSFK